MPTKARWAAMSEEEKQKYKEATKRYQQANRDYWRELNRKSYLKLSNPSRRNVLNRTEEDREQKARDKANNRCTRAKEARVSWDKELTDLVFTEAHKLRLLRNKLTGFEWHVDHVIPLRGKEVSGLHVWNNFAVIPKIDNLRKGNKNSIHEKWQAGLQN